MIALMTIFSICSHVWRIHSSLLSDSIIVGLFGTLTNAIGWCDLLEEPHMPLGGSYSPFIELVHWRHVGENLHNLPPILNMFPTS